jgi:hypothetical protein
MKYFYITTAVLSLILSVITEFDGRRMESGIALLISVLAFGIYDILAELKNNNKEVIVRDPKTGRFKKC